MKIVEQSVNVWGECPTDIQEAKLWIERAGRTCYNSPMPAEPNPDKFLDRVMSHDPPHSSMFEHSNLALGFWPYVDMHNFIASKKYDSKWIYMDDSGDHVLYGNYRAFMEATDTESIDSVIETIRYDGLFTLTKEQLSRKHRRVTVELHTDRNVLAEITRHRNDVAFSVRSQRYVDENGLMEFVKPSWYDSAGPITQQTFLHACQQSELNYRTLRREFPPQHARTVLNGQVKTIIVMTAYLPQWDWIFKLRRASNAYPQMIALMDMVYDQFLELGYAESN